ncbi:MAG: hypothetical protein AB7I45_01440 [Planctomycetota bacterium]
MNDMKCKSLDAAAAAAVHPKDEGASYHACHQAGCTDKEIHDGLVERHRDPPSEDMIRERRVRWVIWGETWPDARIDVLRAAERLGRCEAGLRGRHDLDADEAQRVRVIAGDLVERAKAHGWTGVQAQDHVRERLRASDDRQDARREKIRQASARGADAQEASTSDTAQFTLTESAICHPGLRPLELASDLLMEVQSGPCAEPSELLDVLLRALGLVLAWPGLAVDSTLVEALRSSVHVLSRGPISA